jgi:predicted RND superfamily exporter protein
MAGVSRDDRARRLVAWQLRHGRALWLAALVALVPAAYATARLYLHLSSDVEELLPRDAPSVRATDELRRRVPGLSTLGVVVDAGTPERLPAAERLLDDLAARIRAYPPSLVRAVRTGAADERRFFQRFGPLYVDTADLEAIRAQVEARRRWEINRRLGILLEDEPPPPLDFRALRGKYAARLPGVGDTPDPHDRFSNRAQGITVLLVEGTEATAGARGARELLGRVRADLRRLGGTARYAPGMRVGFAGNVAVSVEELSALSQDLGVSSVLVVSAVLGVLLLYFGWWIAIPALLLPLAVGTLVSFAAAATLPFGIDRLNSSTAFLGSIVVGNGVNFGIIWLARYAEARRRGGAVEAALAEAMWGARPGTLIAALAAATAYGSLIVTQFRGFRQFGIIGALGMLACWGATFLLSPPLLAWLEGRSGRVAWPPRPFRRSGAVGAAEAPGGAAASAAPGRLAPLVDRHAGAIVLVGALVTAGALMQARRFDASHIESDFSRLRRRDTWTSGEGYWGRKMDAVLKRNLSPTVILTDSVAAAEATAARLRLAARAAPPLSELLAQVRALDDVLPPDQPRRIAELERLRRLFTPAMRAALPPEQLADLDRLLGQGPLRPVRPEDLPPTLTTGLRERDGSLGRTVLVYPRLTKRLWQADLLAGFVGSLREVAVRAAPPGQPAGRVAGYLPIAADITQALRRDGPLASGVALAAVALLVMLVFRGRPDGLWVLGSLVLGVLWMLGLTLLLRVKINYANFVAFPITFGIGVDYAVNIMARYRQEMVQASSSSSWASSSRRPSARARAIRAALHSTGGAVALCSLTTSLGYSSLLIAKNRALSLFGTVAVAGELSCLSTAVILLPAVVLFLPRVRWGRWPRFSRVDRERPA